jgi:hypothetical protein
MCWPCRMVDSPSCVDLAGLVHHVAGCVMSWILCDAMLWVSVANEAMTDTLMDCSVCQALFNHCPN